MANLPPLTQGQLSVFEDYWSQLDKTGSGKLDGGTAARFLKRSQLREPILHKIWNLSDPGGTGFLDKPGFFMALRLIATCQNGKEPTLSSITATDPIPKLAGLEVKGSANKWTVEAEERSKFEVMFQQLQPVGGLLSGDKVKPIMIASKLPVEALKNIWNLADIDQDGKMDKEEFIVAMKLITLVQSGESLPQTLPSSLVPPSKMKGTVPAVGVGVSSAVGGVLASLASTTLSGKSSPRPSPSPIAGSPLPAKKEVVSSSMSSSSSTVGGDLAMTEEWVITSDVKTKYDSYFAGIDKDHDGYVTGDEARGLFMASNLPASVLGHIWNLCDVTNTGRLNSEQFALAMFIIAEKVRGKEVPKELTPAMIPPSLRKIVQQQQQQAPPTSSTPFSSGVSLSSAVWTTPTATPLLATAVTSVTTVTSAWPSASTNSGSNIDPAGRDVASGGFGSDFSAIKELDTITNEIEDIRQEKTKLSDDIVSKQKLIQERKGELELLQSDVDMATRQREDLEKDKTEAQNKLDQLDSEKARFESQMAELKQKCQDEREEIERLKSQLAEQETSKKFQSEELEKLREQLEGLKREEREYKMKVDTSTAELERVQKANQNIQSEMSQVRQKIDLLKEEHQTLNNELSLYPSVSTATSSVININDVGQLSAELTVPHVSEPDAISARATAGSSSPVSSISGFSTNSHLDDGGDESSVGGASRDPTQQSQQASHDPFASVTSGNDPFAAFSLPSTDPFFPPSSGGSKFTGKPSLLSAFDPLGGSDPFGPSSSDPFKSSPGGGSSAGGGTTNDDPFRTDPFGSSSSVPSATAAASSDPPGSLGGSSTDPFSGQDPFSSDPFASSPTGIKESSSPWGSTSPFPGGSTSPFPGVGDPFNQQNAQTPTDPFSGNDPFGDDPFASKTRTDEAVNPFAAAPGPSSSTATAGGGGDGGSKAAKREEIVIPDALPKPGPGASNKEQVAWAKRESEREEAFRKLREFKEEEDLARAIKESMST